MEDLRWDGMGWEGTVWRVVLVSRWGTEVYICMYERYLGVWEGRLRNGVTVGWRSREEGTAGY